MSDRFKFRAKRIDNNKFIYGYLCFIYIDNDKHCKIYSPDDAMSYDCYTETLGQCTGLKDKNGQLIYEGDIVRFTLTGGFNYVTNEDGVVTYKLGAFYVVNDLTEYLISDINTNKVEVVGNKYENPEFRAYPKKI